MPKPNTARIRKTFTFTVDLDAMANEYGVTPGQAREMFARDVESFTDPAEWCLAWPMYVTAITVPSSA
jgi:hypothetical protein